MNVSQTICNCGKLVNMAPGVCVFCGRELGDKVSVISQTTNQSPQALSPERKRGGGFLPLTPTFEVGWSPFFLGRFNPLTGELITN